MSLYSDVILARNPVAYFPLGEGAGPYRDATGHGYLGLPDTAHGAIYGAGSKPFPSSDQSLLMTSDNGSWGASVILSATDPSWPLSRVGDGVAPWTFEYWARKIAGDLGGVVLGANDALPDGGTFSLEGPTIDGSVQVGAGNVREDQSSLNLFADPVPATQWQYIVGGWDGTQWFASVNCTRLVQTLAQGTFWLPIVCAAAGLNAQFFLHIEAAHVALYDRALTSDEIAAGCAAARPHLRFTYAPGGGTARWTVPAGRTSRFTYSG